MNIGVSLPLGYLTGAEDGAGATSLSTAFGSPGDCLAELKDHGVTYIELQGLGPDTPRPRVMSPMNRRVASITFRCACCDDDTLDTPTWTNLSRVRFQAFLAGGLLH